MERTTKIKIALCVTLFFLAVRFVIGFFPVPIEFAPYTGEPGKSSLQEIYITEIRHYMSVANDVGDTVHYYEVKSKDGQTGLISSQNVYQNKVYKEPIHITGVQNILTKVEQLDASNVNAYFKNVEIKEPFLSQYNGDKQKAYTAVEKMAVLNRDYTETTEDNPAAFWIAACAFVSFCVMVAMLLKEYAGNRRGSRKNAVEE